MAAPSSRRLALAFGLLLANACSSEKARAPETPADAAPPGLAGAEAEVAEEAFGPMQEKRNAEAGDELDQLLALEADLGRYEAALWREGVPVRAYAQRPETEEQLGRELEGEAEPSRDADAGDRAATATPPTSKPDGKSGAGGGSAARKSEKTKSAKSPNKSVRPYEQDAGAGDGLGGPAKHDGDPAQRCQTVCEVAAAICEIEARVCEMADRHPDDLRYSNACERASDDCRVATEACQQCSTR